MPRKGRKHSSGHAGMYICFAIEGISMDLSNIARADKRPLQDYIYISICGLIGCKFRAILISYGVAVKK